MNKILIKLYVPYIDEEYDVLIPINKKVGTIKKILINTVYELSECSIDNPQNLRVYDKTTGMAFENDIYVRDSTIKNGTKIILL